MTLVCKKIDECWEVTIGNSKFDLYTVEIVR